MTTFALNNLWTYLQGLSLERSDREWLASKLIEPEKTAEAGVTPREGWAAAAQQAHADGADKLIAADVFADENVEEWKW